MTSYRGGGKQQRVEAVLRTRIADGTYPPGSPLPSQRELAEDFGVNHNTIKKVLARLAAAELIERPGRGGSRAVVTSRGGHAAALSVSDDAVTWAQKLGDGATDELVEAVHEQARRTVAIRLGVDEGTAVVRRVRYQRRGDTLMVVHTQWVTAEVAETIREATGQAVDDVNNPPADDLFTLMARAGLRPAEATEVSMAREATTAEQALLGMPTGVPILTTTRITIDDDGEPLEYSVMPSRGDLVTLSYTSPIRR